MNNYYRVVNFNNGVSNFSNGVVNFDNGVVIFNNQVVNFGSGDCVWLWTMRGFGCGCEVVTVVWVVAFVILGPVVFTSSPREQHLTAWFLNI